MKLRRMALGLVVPALVLGGCHHPGERDLDGHDGDRRDHAIAAPRHGLDTAELAVVSGATTVAVRAADLGDDLYRVTTPDDSRIAPNMVEQDGLLQLHLDGTGLAGPAAVQVLLNRDVRWQVRLAGGATESFVDVREGRISGLDFAAGSSRIEVRLPRPEQTVVVRMAGGAGEFLVHAPADVPTRVNVGGGAASVTVDGARRSGVSGGTLLTPAGWEGAEHRYDIDATAGVSTLTVDRG